jgi:hypothetical protein
MGLFFKKIELRHLTPVRGTTPGALLTQWHDAVPRNDDDIGLARNGAARDTFAQ